MALIRVSPAKHWKCNRRVFEALLQDACERLGATHLELAQAIARAVESRLPWWSMETLTPSEFAAVRRAVQGIHQTWAEQKDRSAADEEVRAGRLARLQELLELLVADERATR